MEKLKEMALPEWAYAIVECLMEWTNDWSSHGYAFDFIVCILFELARGISVAFIENEPFTSKCKVEGPIEVPMLCALLWILNRPLRGLQHSAYCLYVAYALATTITTFAIKKMAKLLIPVHYLREYVFMKAAKSKSCQPRIVQFQTLCNWVQIQSWAFIPSMHVYLNLLNTLSESITSQTSSAV